MVDYLDSARTAAGEYLWFAIALIALLLILSAQLSFSSKAQTSAEPSTDPNGMTSVVAARE